jgi:hypothetical protein
MKKFNLLLIVSFLIASFCYSQTPEIEKENMVKMYESGKVNLEEYQELVKQWHELLADVGEYPKLPFNESLGIIRFEFVNQYSFNKEVIFKRIKEWGAITFGALNSVLHYEDFESGKIILKGYFDIPYVADVKMWFRENEVVSSSKCYHTYIFTIKDNKLKVQITSLEYEISYIAGYASGKYTRSVHSLYPVTADNLMQWKSKLSLLVNTDIEIKSLVKRMDMYIRSYQNDYDF